DKTNPLLGTSLVVTRETLDSRHDDLVAYLKALKATFDVVIDGGDELAELIPQVREDWDLPQLDDPEAATPVIQGVADMWLAAGRDNLLRNVPERWEEGVEGFKKLKIAKEDASATDFYTNDL